MTMSIESIESFAVDTPRVCVERGAALLDTLTPDWYRGINIHSLSISDPGMCILTQTYGDYLDGLNAVKDHLDEDVVGYWGFACFQDEDAVLVAAWQDEIRTRILADAGANLQIGTRRKDYVLV